MSKLEILNPISGTLIVNTKIKDETFSKNMIGECFGVVPNNNLVCAPISGKITLISGHAFCIQNDQGIQVLVHMGIDTVQIPEAQKLKIFDYTHKIDDIVNAKEIIVNVNWEEIKELGYDITTPVVVLKESIPGMSFSMDIIGPCDAGEAVATIE